MTATMRALQLDRRGGRLQLREVDRPSPGAGQVLLRVSACAICRTDLHIVDGDLTDAKYPLIPGHELVGRVVASGDAVSSLLPGERVGVSWLGWACGVCEACRTGRENLCDAARFTGYQLDGGFAEYAVADARFCFRLPREYSDCEAAPLLCAGLIGHRSLRAAGDCHSLGLYGFGAAAHVVCQEARWRGMRVYAFTRPGDARAQQFARELGAVWAGGSNEAPSVLLDGAIVFAPVGALVPEALARVRKAGTVVCGGIHMTDLPSMPYRLLWGERVLRSVANLTRRDGEEFLRIAPLVPVRTHVTVFPLEAADEALAQLRGGGVKGAAVFQLGTEKTVGPPGFEPGTNRL